MCLVSHAMLPLCPGVDGRPMRMPLYTTSSTPAVQPVSLLSSVVYSTLVTCTNSGSLTLWPEDQDKVCMHLDSKHWC